MSEWKKLKKEHYGRDEIVSREKGSIDFSPDGMKSVRGGENLSYNEYLEVQKNSCGKTREYLEICYRYSYDCDFKGQINRIENSKGKVMFKRLFIEGMYRDGIGFFGKEDHVWMDIEPFNEFAVGDCVRFNADIYRYIKTGRGKQIAFGLENPSSITKISSYEIPTDEELVDQQINQLVCETCKFYEQCTMGNCLANEQERKERFETLKSLEPGKFTERTVMLAYELEYRIFMQMGGIRLDKKDKHYPVIKRLIEICATHPVYAYGDVQEVLFKMVYPDKPRLYIED